MKKVFPIVLLTIACSLSTARPADAQSGIIRWIEKLSGPGPLIAYGYELYPICIGTNTGRARSGVGRPAAQQAAGSGVTAAFDINCRGFTRTRLLTKIGFQYAQFFGDNKLQYDASVPGSLSDTVYGNIYAVTLDASFLAGRVDAGGSFGWMHFTGAPDGPVTHQLHEIRGTLNVLPMVTGGRADDPPPQWYKRDWIQFRVSWNIVPGGLEDSDFGAVPGSFPRTDVEHSLRPTLLFNIGNIFDW